MFRIPSYWHVGGVENAPGESVLTIYDVLLKHMADEKIIQEEITDPALLEVLDLFEVTCNFIGPVDDGQPKKNKNERRQTKKVLNNNYLTKNIAEESFGNSKITICPAYDTDRHEESFTDDPVLMQERKETKEILYKLFRESPYYGKYPDDPESKKVPKIPKDDIMEIFYYFKERLEKAKKISTIELIIGINEFFDFNYDYIAKKVLSPMMLRNMYDEYDDIGYHSRMEGLSSISLF